MEENNNQRRPDDVPDSGLVADEEAARGDVFSPVEQHTINFYGKPIVVVRLPDGRPAVVMRYLCDNMQLDRSSQIRRIQRTKAIAEDLVNVMVQTKSAVQKMPALILRSVPYWLLGIDPGRARPEMQEEILHYQKEAVDVLYAWAQAPRAVARPTQLMPTEGSLKPMSRPVQPSPAAPADEWATYHEQMALFYRWKRTVDTRLDTVDLRLGEVEQRQDEMESRVEGMEEVVRLVPEILERLGPQKIIEKHQQQVRAYVHQLSQATGNHSSTIYTDLYTAFSVPRYQELQEEDWPQLEQWFRGQLERAKRKK